MDEWPVEKLRAFPRQAEFFLEETVDPERVRTLVESVRTGGVLQPVVITADGTILAGHHRVQAAREVGLETVPVQVVPVEADSDEALQVFLDSNLTVYRMDPMTLAKVAKERARLAGVRRGRPSKIGHNVRIAVSEPADSLPIEERQFRRFVKLNELIEPLQALVRSGRLGTTQAEALAHLEPEEQAQVLTAIGEAAVADLTVADAKDLRWQVEEARARVAEETQARESAEREAAVLGEQVVAAESERDALAARVEELERAERAAKSRDEQAVFDMAEELAQARRTIGELQGEIADGQKKLRALEAQAATPERVEIVVEKTVEVPDPELLRRVEVAEAELARLRAAGGKDPVGAITDEIAKAKAELEEVQAAVGYWRSGEGVLEEAKRFIDSLRKVIWPVENRLGDLERMADGGGLELRRAGTGAHRPRRTRHARGAGTEYQHPNDAVMDGVLSAGPRRGRRWVRGGLATTTSCGSVAA